MISSLRLYPVAPRLPKWLPDMKNGRTTIKVVIDRNTEYLLKATKAKTGVSVSEQVRRAIRLWLGVKGWTIGHRRTGRIKKPAR